MFTKFRMKEEKGFTLIELLIVVAIIGILAAIAIPQFGAYRKRGYNASSNSDLRGIRTTEEAMMADFSEYGGPTAAAGSTTSITLTGGKTTSTPQSINLSPNVFAGIKMDAVPLAGTSILFYTATTGHASGDNFYAAESDVTTIYRGTMSASPATAATVYTANPGATTAGDIAAAGTCTGCSAAWVTTQ